MAYTDIDDPSAYFQTKLYTGTNNELVLTFDGNSDLQTDMIWTKNRSRSSTNHVLSDTVRGIGKGLYPDLTNSEGDTNYISAIGSDGYTIVSTDSVEINRLNDTFVSWNWKAGTSFTNDASATGIGSIDSTGSVNTDAGFSIVSFTGTGANATISHGLGAIPKMMIFKTRDYATAWVVYHKSVGATKGLFLNTTGTGSTVSAYFQDTDPTSSVFSVGSDNDTNRSSSPMIAYCFAEKQGYSKFGSYVATGDVSGAFIYTGFKIGWLMIKRTDSAAGWIIYDSKREGRNTENDYLLASSNSSEGGNNEIDLYSNGFKPREANRNELNVSGASYVYLAFAENPFVTSTGVPATAR